jgi:uncharacterized protein
MKDRAPTPASHPPRLRRFAGCIWQHRKLSLVCTLLFAFVLFNAFCYIHARAMTHYANGSSRTPPPEKLSILGKIKVLLTGVQVPRPNNVAAPDSFGLNYTTERFVASDGVQLEAWHVDCQNAKGLVILFHGYAACRDSLLREAQAFHDMGCASLLVDFRGGGGSSGNVTTIGVEEAEDVTGAVAFVKARWPELPLILYGHSMGSAAILRACSVHSIKPTAIILECPFDSLLATVENRFDAMGLPSFPAAQFLVFWGGVQHGFNGFVHNPSTYANEVTCPVLMLHGSADPRVHPEQAQKVFTGLKGIKRFELLSDVGHESYLEARPAQWRKCVSAFLVEQVGQ